VAILRQYSAARLRRRLSFTVGRHTVDVMREYDTADTRLEMNGSIRMSAFEQLYQNVAIVRKGEAVSADLKPLLAQLYDALVYRPVDLLRIKTRLIALLAFLMTPSGRTNANCWAVDLFFDIREDWESDWFDIPEEYREIFGDMGGALHDTVEHPEIADNFWSTPEQLFERASRLPVYEAPSSS
jgi:hypothetical protein